MKNCFRVAAGAGTLMALLACASASETADDTSAVPGSAEFDARGEQATAQVCANMCHGWDIVLGGPRMLPSQWDFVVSDMLGRGAMATQEQLDAIGPWLKWTWGAVWVNSAAPAELGAVLGLTSEEAEAVVRHREQHGKFADLDALKAVPGVDPEKLEARSAAIVFN